MKSKYLIKCDKCKARMHSYKRYKKWFLCHNCFLKETGIMPSINLLEVKPKIAVSLSIDPNVHKLALEQCSKLFSSDRCFSKYIALLIIKDVYK